MLSDSEARGDSASPAISDSVSARFLSSSMTHDELQRVQSELSQIRRPAHGNNIGARRPPHHTTTRNVPQHLRERRQFIIANALDLAQHCARRGRCTGG